MKLISLHLENFKGHKDLTVHFGDITRISGANGTGKTSIFDAFMFVLIGKDSLGRVCGTGQKGEATIRPRSADGELVREIEISVTARVMDEDGQLYELKRIYLEKYSADKNSGAKIFQGNTTKYYINSEPMQAGRYDAWIKENFDPDLFSLTGNPAYFPDLPWQDQRTWLLKVSGDVTDEQVIAEDPVLKSLENLLTKHDIAGVKSMATEQLRLANKAVKEGVVRIDQTVKLAGNRTESDLTAEISRLEKSVAEHDQNVTEAESAVVAAKNGTRAGRLKNEVAALDVELDVFRAKRRAAIEEVKRGCVRQEQDLQAAKKAAEESIKSKRALLSGTIGNIKEAEDRKEALYLRYDEEDQKAFTTTECPLCHQPLPEGRVAELQDKFNLDKAEHLEKIVEEGKAVAARIADLKKQQELVTAAIAAEERTVSDAQKKLDGMYELTQAALAAVPELEEDGRFVSLRSKRDALYRELQDLNAGDEANLKPLQDALQAARKAREEVQSALNICRSNLHTLQSVQDLQADLQHQREVADTASATLRLVSLYTQVKCRMLTDKVNSLFPGLEWRLFIQNIGNDDIVETCELLMHGVPYRDLSAGEKIRAGLIIVDTLQDKLGVLNPVFIDGAESITFAPEVKSQLILLRAQENIKELKIEEA